MNKRIESDPENIITLGVYYPKYGRAYEDMDEFSQMILDIKKDERRIYPQSGEYYYYKKAIRVGAGETARILNRENITITKKQSTTLRIDCIPFFQTEISM